MLNRAIDRHLLPVAFALGCLAVLWTGAGFLTGHPLALAMTALIGLVYLFGAWELQRFRRDTATLRQVLQQTELPPPDLTLWAQQLPGNWRTAILTRLDSDRLPQVAPALTPYLVGLLVMLGMLGTFVGMVMTFQGAVLALEGSADLQAIRASLAAPVKGLGLSFATSVAGVATSATLGLMLALVRRERAGAVRLLERCVSGVLRTHSSSYQRDRAYRALDAQTEMWPAVARQLQAVAEGLARQGQQTDERLLRQQQAFHDDTRQVYTGLAERVEQAMTHSLAASGQAAAQAMRPVMADALHAMTEQVKAWQRQQASEMSEQVERLLSGWREQMADWWQRQDEREGHHARQMEALTQRLEAQWREMAHSLGAYVEQQGASVSQLNQTMDAHWQEARGRDQALLAERAAFMDRLAELMETLRGTGQEFHQRMQEQAEQTAHTAGRVNASAVELASLGAAFADGVKVYAASSEQLLKTLHGVESALRESMQRSDEQLAYYVAQAREVVDLSVAAQQQLLQGMNRLRASGARQVPVGEAA